MTELKRIVIAGISSDIGAVLARELASDVSVRILGTMRRARIGSDIFPSNIEVLDRCDLTKADDCTRLAVLINERFDGPFGYIHSVGNFWEHVPFLDVGAAEADQMFGSHVSTLYHAFQALVPIMRAKGGASSIAFSCNSVKFNYPWMASFTASKAAIESLMRSLANEFAGENMRFNSLILASVKTEKVHKSKPQGDFDHYISPKELVPILRFLMSPEARLINGSAINLFEYSPRYYKEGYFQRIGK